MQTFLPYASFKDSAKSLDSKRLGKQRVEVKQIFNCYTGKLSRWNNHPAVRMWRGHHIALLQYGLDICEEWQLRGFEDTLYDEFSDWYIEEISTGVDIIYPPWLGDRDFHRSHRANLVRKDPEFYIPKFGNLDSEPYIWPIK